MTGKDDMLATILEFGKNPALAELAERRADVMRLTQLTHLAALLPTDPGGISHAERAGLAWRIAVLNADPDFAAQYEGMLAAIEGGGTCARFADLRFDGGGDARLRVMLRHVDLVAARPKDATEADIRQLQDAGHSDADIVRLSELIAFVSYHLRLAAGLRLIGKL